MNLTRVSIMRPLFILMVILAMVLMGAVGYSKLGMDLFPSVNIPVATIVTQFRYCAHGLAACLAGVS